MTGARNRGVQAADEDPDLEEERGSPERQRAVMLHPEHLWARYRIMCTCAYEVCRQVSLHCVERGRLMASLWQLLSEAFVAAMTERDANKQRIRELKMEAYSLESDADQETRELREAKERLERECKRLRDRCAVLEEENSEFRGQMDAVDEIHELVGEMPGGIRAFVDQTRVAVDEINDLKQALEATRMAELEQRDLAKNAEQATRPTHPPALISPLSDLTLFGGSQSPLHQLSGIRAVAFEQFLAPHLAKAPE